VSVVEFPVRNLSVRHKDIRARLWNPKNGHHSSDLDVIPNGRAEALRREKEHRQQERAKKLEEVEATRLRMARKRRALELLAEFHASVDAWVIEAGNEPLTPFLPRLTCTQIIHATADYFGLTELDMVSARRTANVLYPRMVAMYIARTQTPCSTPMIGQRFGGRDHTTVLNAIHNAEEKIKSGDAKFAADVAAIKQQLGVE
jgi:chromosomal replication initiation ATPase DnaA